MASTVSPSAIHRIISLVLYAPIGKKSSCGASYVLSSVNRQWKALYKLYMATKPAPPLGYLSSFEMALVLKDEVDDEDADAIFADGKPLDFWGCTRMLVSKIIEAFRKLQEEPAYLDVTITALDGVGPTGPSEAWPQVYKAHLPCHACTTVEEVEERSIPRASSWSLADPTQNVKFAVEKFHVSSSSFHKRLTLSLHYRLTQGMTENERFSDIHKISIRLADETETCSAQRRLSGIANRSSATPLLLPEFACEVFGFLERAHVGSSLLANRGLRDRICLLKQRLPVHHLKCTLEKVVAGPECGFYWLTVHHRQRDMSYTDVRHFTFPSTAGAEDDCDLIRCYLSNSYLRELRPADFPFTMKMLASLAACNVSVGHVELHAGSKRRSDYRSMDAVFGGMRMSDLYLSWDEHRFVEFVKTTDFFRMSTVQGLRKLKLELGEPLGYPWSDEEPPRGHARSKSPLWVSAIYLMRNCEYYQVNYQTDRHMRSFERKVVRICEEFERGKIADTVQHFHFNTLKEVSYAFNPNNRVASGMKVEGESEWDPVKYFSWDVYRFRHARTHEYLTACIGRNSPMHGTRSILHIVRGEVYPTGSFAIY